MNKGDSVLVTFPFTNLSGSKLRPAVILFASDLDFTACFITTKTDWKEPTDIDLAPNATNGLKKDSIIRTNKIATLDKQLARGLLGKINQIEMVVLDINLKTLLRLT